MLKVETASGRWTPFCEQILAFLKADVLEMCVDGARVRGFRSPDSSALWIRDHSDTLRGGKYLEPDVRSAPECFARMQAANGRLYDYVSTRPEKPPCERENWEKWVRVPVEADVEYRFVKAAYLAWQACGDTEWLRTLLPACDRALTYSMTHRWRWDAEHGLVKRAYTIDTWDFDYTAGRTPWLNFQITNDTFWGISHADNSGLYEATLLLARMYENVGEPVDAQRWAEAAEAIRERANAGLFNGRYYRHFHKLMPLTIDGVDEEGQLSLSNPMAINRGMATHEMAVSVIEEYRRRGREGRAFAPWFSIDPPFPDGVFGDEKLVGGAYINGGIFPLAGGELARAALEHGYEHFGCEILEQYRAMIAESGETYLWYFPDGTPSSVETSTSPEATPTDGWGSSAMLYAFVEGLCGIEDLGHSFENVRCAPRWIAAGEHTAVVQLSYAASGASFGYRFAHYPERSSISITLNGCAGISLHAMLPKGSRTSTATWDGQAVPCETTCVEGTPYADLTGSLSGTATVEVRYART